MSAASVPTTIEAVRWTSWSWPLHARERERESHSLQKEWPTGLVDGGQDLGGFSCEAGDGPTRFREAQVFHGTGQGNEGGKVRAWNAVQTRNRHQKKIDKKKSTKKK
jgi:hypothetical protein